MIEAPFLISHRHGKFTRYLQRESVNHNGKHHNPWKWGKKEKAEAFNHGKATLISMVLSATTGKTYLVERLE